MKLYNILKLLFFVLLYANVSYSQTLNLLKQDFPPPLNANTSGYCDVSGFSVMFSSNILLDIAKFSGVGITIKKSNSIQNDLSKQIFYFTVPSVPLGNNNISLRYTDTFSKDFPTVGFIQCLDPPKGDYVKYDSYLVNSFTMMFVIEFYNKSYNTMECMVAKPYRCEMQPAHNGDNYLNRYIVKLFLTPEYNSLSSTINVMYNSRGYIFNTFIPSLFPYNEYASPSQIFFEIPVSWNNFTEDFTLQLGSLGPLSFATLNASKAGLFYSYSGGLNANLYYTYKKDKEYIYQIGGINLEQYSNTNYTLSLSISSNVSIYSMTYNFPKLPLGISQNLYLGSTMDNSYYLASTEIKSNLIKPIVIETVTSISLKKGLVYSIPFPYKLNSTGFYYKFEQPLSKDFAAIVISQFYDGSNPEMLNINSPPTAIVIKLNKFKMLKVTSYQFLCQVTIETNYDVVYIGIGDNQYLYSSDISNKNGNITIYEKLFDMVPPSNYKITINSVRQTTVFSSGQAYNTNFDILPNSKPFDKYVFFNELNITGFQFEKNNITVPNITIDNAVKFNLTTFIPDLQPSIVLYYNNGYNNLTFDGYYRYDMEYYVIPFSIPPYFIDENIQYSIIDKKTGSNVPGALIVNGSLIIRFPEDLNTLQPLILSIDAPGSIVTSNSSLNLYWMFYIPDYSNSTKGTFDIVSTVDVEPVQTITFNSSHLVDLVKGSYYVDFTISNFSSKILAIKNMKLYNSISNQTHYNPLRTLYGTNSNSKLSIQVLYNGLKPAAPDLSFFSISPSVSVYSKFRSILANISISSTSYNLNKGPTIVLTSDNFDIFNFTVNYVSSSSNIHNFNAMVDVPYGFGMSTIYVSVYGIVDTYTNYKGYTSSELKAKGFSNSIIRSTGAGLYPMIEQSSRITQRGGSLTLFGKQFGVDNGSLRLQVDYNDGLGFQNTSIDLFSGVILTTNTIVPFNSSKISVILMRNNVFSSNTFIIYAERLPSEPTLTPTVTPTITPNVTTTPTVTPTVTPNTTTTPSSTPSCPGNPTCNGHGTCSSSGCLCNAKWYGPSCSSEIIIIPPPPAQPEPTTNYNVTNPTDGGDRIITDIKVVEIREIDNLNNVVNTFNLKDTIFTDDSKQRNHTTYIYSSKLEGRDTFVNVTIEFFKDETSINFGNQTIDISPSTIKYSINISSFDFKQKTNLLQVIMEASVKSDNGDSCSSKQLGIDSGNNLQWVKMNIDKLSIYGKFLKYAIIDDRVQNIQNTVIDDSIGSSEEEDTSQFRSTKIGINIPYYEKSAILDPDFSNLIDVAGNDADLLCKSKKKLSNGAIAGIVVGATLFVAIVVGSVILVKKKTMESRQANIMNHKLEKISSNS